MTWKIKIILSKINNLNYELEIAKKLKNKKNKKDEIKRIKHFLKININNFNKCIKKEYRNQMKKIYNIK